MFKFNPITSQLDLVSTGGGGGGSLDTINSVSPDGANNIDLVGSGPITITPDDPNNRIIIGSTYPFLTWSIITANQMALTQNGYFTNGGATVEVQLPATSAIGDTFVVSAYNADGWKVIQDSGQQIFIGDQNTTLGATGYLQSTKVGDSVTLVCSEADTAWVAALGYVGNITVV